MLDHNVKMSNSPENNKKVCRSKNLELIKAKLGDALNAYERRELIKFLEQIGSCDIIQRLPISTALLVFQHFSPQELCQLRLVSKDWNRKVSHDCVWKPICHECSIVPSDTVVTDGDGTAFVFFNAFKRSMTVTRNWKVFQSKRYELHYNKGPILSLLAAHLTRVFSGDVDGSIHVWNAQSNQYVTSLNAHKKHVSCLTRHNHLLASGSSDTTIAIHDIVTFKQLNLLQGHEGPVTSLVFAPSAASDGKLLLVSGSTDRTIRIWNTADSACLRILHGQENTIISLAFCASIPLEYCQSELDTASIKNNTAGYIISGSSDRNIFVWDLKSSIQEDTPQVINSIMGTNGPVTAMAVYDGTKATAASLWSNPLLAAKRPVQIPPLVIYAGLQDATITLCSIPGLEKTYVAAPNIHRGTIWSISPATVHSKIITTSGDRTAMIWDLKSPKSCITLGGFDSAIVASAVSPQEEIVCFGTERGTIVVFDLQEFY